MIDKFMQLAQQIQNEANAILPQLIETGELDMEALGRMEAFRRQIITSEAATPLDTLLQFGCIRSVSAFLLGVVQCDDDDMEEALRLAEIGLQEILVGLNAIRPKLEKDVGTTLRNLGLFVDKETLQ